MPGDFERRCLGHVRVDLGRVQAAEQRKHHVSCLLTGLAGYLAIVLACAVSGGACEIDM